MAEIKLSKNNNTKADFFGMLFHARDYFHLKHLSVTGIGSFAEHLALEALYKGILKLVDTLVETEQGINGFIDIDIPATNAKASSVDFLNNLIGFIKKTRIVFSESFQQNIIDEIQELLAQNLYKIKYLK